GEALPPFAPPPAEDGAAPARPHARPEPVGFGALALLRLVGALHRRGSIRTAAKSFLRDLRAGGFPCPGAALWSPPRCRMTRHDKTSTPSGGRPRTGSAPRSRT